MDSLLYFGLFALFAGVVLPLVGFFNIKKEKLLRQSSILLSCIALAALAVFSAGLVVSGGKASLPTYHILEPFKLSFAIDRLSAFFIFLISTVSFSIMVYSIQYLEHALHDRRKNLVASLMNVYVLAMVLMVASSNMLAFIFFWELMAMSSFILVMTEYEKKETEKAGVFYFIMTHLSTAFLLFAFILLYLQSGSLDMQQVRAEPAVLAPVFLALFLGFGIKAGVVPFHKWLPYAHPASPSNISALMSGVMIKVAIYGLIRFVLLLPAELWWGVLILAAGTVSAILGVIYALKEHDLKRLLAYHSIENIGIILIGFGLYLIFSISGLPDIALLGLAGALFHTLNHALFKSLLFMSAGAVAHSTQTRNIEDMGGLIKRMPATALFFLIGAVSISALPPFNGFVSELMIFQAFFQAYALNSALLKMLLVISLSVFALTSALAAACFVKAFGITFLAQPRSEKAAKAVEAPMLMLAGQAIPAILCIVFGLFSFQIFGWLGFALPIPNMLFIGAGLVAAYFVAWAVLRTIASDKERTGETWGCGIISQKGYMEYTASGFSEPIVTIFRSVYRTEKHSERVYFDRQKSIFKEGFAEIHLIKFFEEKLYLPVANSINRIAIIVNGLQRGHVDLYIAYAFLTLTILLLVIWGYA